jgi:hypothetical protein
MDDPTQPKNDLDIPLFLKRDPITNRAEYMSDTEELGEKRKSRPAETVKKSDKTRLKVMAEKTVKVSKAKPESVEAESKTGKDQFGLRKGSARSEAAAMYARKSGATLAEVEEQVGSIQLNVLIDLKKKGWLVEQDTEKRKGQGKRPVTRYYLKLAK